MRQDTDGHVTLQNRALHTQRLLDRAVLGICFGASLVGLFALAILFAIVLQEAYHGAVAYDVGIIRFLTSSGSIDPGRAGFYAAMVGSLWLMVFAALLAFFVGVGTAVYLVEYAPDTTGTRLIEANLANLAGVPSVVYGLVCLGVLVNGPLRAGRVILVGAIALGLLVLPIIVVAAMEALRAVPDGMRAGARAAGATEWQTVRTVVLPAAMPGIMTGTILALARAMGETAPLLMVGVLVGARHPPAGPFDHITAMTVTIFEWSFNFQPEFHALAAMGIVVLLVLLLGMNGVAMYLRYRYRTVSDRDRP